MYTSFPAAFQKNAAHVHKKTKNDRYIREQNFMQQMQQSHEAC